MLLNIQKNRALNFICSCTIVGFLLICAVEVFPVSQTPSTHLYDITHNLRQPSDIAVSHDGKIFVVDGVNQSIKAFNQQGIFIFSFGTAGAEPGQLKTPLGIDIDHNGKIYLADSGNSRVQIFSSKGDFLQEIKITLKGSNTPDPTDVAVNSNGKTMFVVDNENHCILKYDVGDGRLLKILGKPGIERMEFRYPFLISSFKDKYIYVVDVINTRVQELTLDGKFVRFIGDWGVEKGQFFRPKGVAVDLTGKVFVSDSYLGVIQIFSEGIFHSILVDSQTGEIRRFTTPTGIFIDKNNNLYVTEMFKNKISVFRIDS